MRADDLRDRMERLRTMIEDAEISARNGTVADLAGLDRDVALVCTKTVALPPDQARELQPLMAELIGNLERLATALKDYRDGLKN